jgi:hypothetical protein
MNKLKVQTAINQLEYQIKILRSYNKHNIADSFEQGVLIPLKEELKDILRED